MCRVTDRSTEAVHAIKSMVPGPNFTRYATHIHGSNVSRLQAASHCSRSPPPCVATQSVRKLSSKEANAPIPSE